MRAKIFLIWWRFRSFQWFRSKDFHFSRFYILSSNSSQNSSKTTKKLLLSIWMLQVFVVIFTIKYFRFRPIVIQQSTSISEDDHSDFQRHQPKFLYLEENTIYGKNETQRKKWAMYRVFFLNNIQSFLPIGWSKTWATWGNF